MVELVSGCTNRASQIKNRQCRRVPDRHLHSAGEVMLSREVVSLVSAACMLGPLEGGSARLVGMVDAFEPPEAVEKAADLQSSPLTVQMRAVQVTYTFHPSIRAIHT